MCGCPAHHELSAPTPAGRVVIDLYTALGRLSPDEMLFVLRGLAERVPDLVHREAVYVHERRVWYPAPPAGRGT